MPRPGPARFPCLAARHIGNADGEYYYYRVVVPDRKTTVQPVKSTGWTDAKSCLLSIRDLSGLDYIVAGGARREATESYFGPTGPES